TCRDQGERKDSRSISMTASRSSARIGSIENGWGYWLSAMDRQARAAIGGEGMARLFAAAEGRNFAAGRRRQGGGGGADRGPQSRHPFAGLGRQQDRRGALAAGRRRCRRGRALEHGLRLGAQAAALRGRQLVDL